MYVGQVMHDCLSVSLCFIYETPEMIFIKSGNEAAQALASHRGGPGQVKWDL
jgi:hypothetical protein